MRKLLTLSLILLALFIPFSFTRADIDKEIEKTTRELEQQRKQLADLEKRKEQLAQAIASASFSLAQVSAELSDAEADLTKIQKELSQREKTLKQWEVSRNTLIREFYKQSRVSPLEVALSSDSFIDSTRQLQYYQDNLDVLRENIAVLTGEITTFKENKAKAEKLRNELADLRSQYSALLAYSQRQLSSTSNQLAQVKSSIKGLTARQEQLILEKFAQTSQSETIGDKEPVSTPLPPSGFSPAFAFATYGYPHRVGMNQYGAYGRSKAGQSYTTILSAYYKNTTLGGSCDKSRRIHVDGYFTDVNGDGQDDGILLESEYLMGIGEMPSSWGNSGGMAALKAQVVAARSYALDYVAKKGSICTTQYCQVFLGKGAKKGTPWETAVNATCGKVLTYGGVPIAAWYASTAGGYTLSSQEVWGGYRPWALGIKDFCDLSKMSCPSGAKAFDGPGYGDSPWYHKAWGSRDPKKYTYNPWMTQEEVADIFNTLLLSKYSSSYNKYLSPIDKGGWSMTRVKEKLRSLKISPVEKISALITTPDGKGHTSSVLVCQPLRNPYPCGSPLSFTGKDFRAMFNLRSRGSLVIWTTYFDLIRP